MLTTYFTKLLLGEKKMLLRLYRISIVTKRSSEINFQFPAQGFRGNLLKVVPGPESFLLCFLWWWRAKRIPHRPYPQAVGRGGRTALNVAYQNHTTKINVIHSQKSRLNSFLANSSFDYVWYFSYLWTKCFLELSTEEKYHFMVDFSHSQKNCFYGHSFWWTVLHLRKGINRRRLVRNISVIAVLAESYTQLVFCFLRVSCWLLLLFLMRNNICRFNFKKQI